MIEVESLENPLFSNFFKSLILFSPAYSGQAGRQYKQLRREGAVRYHFKTITAHLRPYSPGAVITFAVFQAGGPSLPTINFRGGFSSLSPPAARVREGAALEIRARSCLQRLVSAFQEPGRDHTEGQGELVKSCGSFI